MEETAVVETVEAEAEAMEAAEVAHDAEALNVNP